MTLVDWVIVVLRVALPAMIFPALVIPLTWVERRGAAFIQDRFGPNRVGPFGLFQAVADAVKMFTKEAVMPAKRAAEKAKANSQAWVVAARCYGSVADNEDALAAATAGLELSPRDPDLLRSQATALAGLNRPEAADALAAYDRFRSPDQSAELRISCAVDSPRCAREREQGHTHTLELVR